MCLTVSYRHHRKSMVEFPEPFICDKDILVFKSLNVTTHSVEFEGDCNYTIKWSTYPCELYATPTFGKAVKFENRRAMLETDKFGKEWDSSTGHAIINEGIHTGKHPGTAKIYGGSSVFFCIIPAGTEFYLGMFDDVVSKKILIFEEDKEFLKYREERGKENVIDVNEFKNF